MMDIGLMIGTMEYAEQRSNYASLASMIAFYAKSIQERGDIQSINRYDELLKRTAPALEIERTFGAGSLLVLEHPDNVALIEADIIGRGRVEAALRYRERLHAVTSAIEMPNQALDPSRVSA